MSEDAANPTMKKFGCIDSSLCFRINREPEIALASPASDYRLRSRNQSINQIKLKHQA
jgi:hypothetical protein